MSKTVHAEADLATDLVAGTTKHLANAGQLLIASGTYTPAELIAELQAIAKLRSDVDAARAQLQAKLTAFETQMPARRLFLEAAASFVKAAFSGSPDVLADFGLEPKRARTPLTVEQKLAAATKRAATRAARHVMGSRQRKQVKGDVTGVTITPVVAPASAEPVPDGR